MKRDDYFNPITFDFIRHWEGQGGYNPATGIWKPYGDLSGKFDVIGYGHRNNENYTSLTTDQVNNLLHFDVAKIKNNLFDKFPAEMARLSPDQVGAVVSMKYSTTMPYTSDFFKYLKAQDYAGLNQFWRNNYIRTGDNYLPGLKARRAAEADTFFAGTEQKDTVASLVGGLLIAAILG